MLGCQSYAGELVFIGCELRSGYNTSWLFWHTRLYMEACLATFVHSFGSLICLANEHSVPLDQIVFWCHHSSFQLFVVKLFQSLLCICGTGYLTLSRQPDHCQPSGSNRSLLCSSSHSQTLFCDIISVTSIVVLAVTWLLRPL